MYVSWMWMELSSFAPQYSSSIQHCGKSRPLLHTQETSYSYLSVGIGIEWKLFYTCFKGSKTKCSSTSTHLVKLFLLVITATDVSQKCFQSKSWIKSVMFEPDGYYSCFFLFNANVLVMKTTVSLLEKFKACRLWIFSLEFVVKVFKEVNQKNNNIKPAYYKGKQ